MDCLVEKVSVRPGAAVKEGDPLCELFSTDMASAKNDYLNREIQWKHDQRLLQLRQKLVEQKAISQQLWVDTQNSAEKSKLDFQVAGDKLKVLGLDDESIGRVGNEDGAQKARLTLRAPVDGTIHRVDAEMGNLYDMKDVLMEIIPSSRAAAPGPK